MATKYLKSKDVKVFPSAYRGTTQDNKLYNPESRLNTEANFINLINRLVTKNSGSFVVSYENNLLICNIRGYLFELAIPSNSKLDGFGDNVYGIIKIADRNPGSNSNNIDYSAASLTAMESSSEVLDILNGLENEFVGLKLTDDSEIVLELGEYSLWLLTWDGSKYIVPSESKFRFTSEDIADIYESDSETKTDKSLKEQLHTEKLIANFINGLKFVGIDSSSVNFETGGKVAYKENKLNVFAETTSSELRDTINGTTGTNNLVFSNTPTLITPILGAATVTSINQLTITESTGKLTIVNGKTLKVDDSITLDGTGTLNLNKNLTVTNDNNITLKAETDNRTLTLTGSPTLSGITTTGGGTLNLSKDLTILSSGGNITLYGNKKDSTLALPEGTLGLTSPIKGGIIYGSSTSTYNSTGTGTSGDILISKGSSAPEWTSTSSITAGKATKLANPKFLWGVSFDGSDNIYGNMSIKGKIENTHNITPFSTNDYNIGSLLTRFKNVYSKNFYGDDFYASSDRRLKENIEDFIYKGSILDLEIKTFTYKDTGKKSFGFIAQDLQEKYPELVDENENGYLSINENKLVYLLLEEIKFLRKKIEKLKE